MSKQTESPCTHPPARYYAGNYYDAESEQWKTWVGCCECGTILTYDAQGKTGKTGKAKEGKGKQ